MNKVPSKESLQAFIDNPDILLDDDDVDLYVEAAKNSPNDIDAMYLSIKRLLDNDIVRQNTIRRRK